MAQLEQVTLEFNIVIEAQSLRVSANGSITGVIFVRLGSLHFPEPGWNDFPVVILTWWVGEVLAMVSGSSQTARCEFMDGPYELELYYAGDDALRVRLIERRGDPVIHAEGLAQRHDVVRALLDASEVVVRECGQRGWQSADISDLSALHERFRSASSQYTRP